MRKHEPTESRDECLGLQRQADFLPDARYRDPFLKRWNWFVEDFMIPMLVDGRISEGEEGPLIASLMAYGVHEVFGCPDWSLNDQLKACLGEADTPVAHKRDPRLAWSRIHEYLAPLSPTWRQQVKEWLEGPNGPKLPGWDILPPTTTVPRRLPSDKARTVLFLQLVKAIQQVRPELDYFRTEPRQRITKTRLSDVRSNGDPSGNPLATHPKASAEAASDRPILEVHPLVFPDVTADDIYQLSQRLVGGDRNRILAGLQDLLSSDGCPELLFDEFRHGPNDRFVVVEGDPDTDLWFVGDLHGDLLALEVAWAYISKRSPSGKVVFLGDLADDEAYNCEIVLRVIELMLENPSRVCLLPGNHDDGLSYREPHFLSSVHPCGFADSLNRYLGGSPKEAQYFRHLGELVIALYKKTPVAIAFKDGLLAAHGGFPLRDRWDSLNERSDLEDVQCYQDFIWTRAHKSLPLKRPNRMQRGCQFGFRDFDEFCDRISEVLGFGVTRMIRGHDHYPERYAFFDKYRNHPMLTINTMSHRLSRESGTDLVRTPCIARYEKDRVPTVYRFTIPEETIAAVHGTQEEKDGSEE